MILGLLAVAWLPFGHAVEEGGDAGRQQDEPA
jgi:hypothetical protein